MTDKSMSLLVTGIGLRDRVPPHTIGGIDRYVNNHINPGSFLRAVLENDLREAMGRADGINRFAIFDIVAYLYNCVPFTCWGSKKVVALWLGEKAEDSFRTEDEL